MEAANAKSEKLGEEGSGRVYQRSVDPLLGSDGDLDMDEGEGGVFLDDLFPKVSLDPPPLRSDGSDELDRRSGGSDRTSDGSNGEGQISGPSIPCASSKVFPDPSADLDSCEAAIFRRRKKTIGLNSPDTDTDTDTDEEHVCDFCGNDCPYVNCMKNPCDLCGSKRHSPFDCSYLLEYFPPDASLFCSRDWKVVCGDCYEEMIDEKTCPSGCPSSAFYRKVFTRELPSPPYDPNDSGSDC